MPGSQFPYLCHTKTQMESATAKCWGGLQIKMPSPGCAHQAVQHCSLGRFTRYIFFYGPFLIHHNTASLLLTSPAKHTSFSLPSFFFSLYLSIHHPFFLGVTMPISTHEQVHIHRLNSGKTKLMDTSLSVQVFIKGTLGKCCVGQLWMTHCVSGLVGVLLNVC